MKKFYNIVAGVVLTGVTLAAIYNPAVLATVGKGAIGTVGNGIDLAQNAIS